MIKIDELIKKANKLVPYISEDATIRARRIFKFHYPKSSIWHIVDLEMNCDCKYGLCNTDKFCSHKLAVILYLARKYSMTKELFEQRIKAFTNLFYDNETATYSGKKVREIIRRFL